MRRVWAFALGLCWLAGCSGDSEESVSSIGSNSESDACALVPGCEMPVNPVDGQVTAIWRVRVERDAVGSVSIGAVEEVDLPSAIGAPVGPQTGTIGLAGLDAAGSALEVQRLRFPETLELESLDGARDATDVSAEPTSIVGYLTVNQSVQDIAVVDAQGGVVASVAAPAPGEAMATAGFTSARYLIQASSRSGCDHIVLLNGPSTEPWNPLSQYSVTTPTALQVAIVRAAVGGMSALHCAAVSRIAFVTSPETSTTTGGWVNGTVADTMYINANFNAQGIDFSDATLMTPAARSLLIGVIVHEAGHSMTRLLQNVRPESSNAIIDGEWAVTSRPLADSTLDNARIQSDFTTLWRRLHTTFVNRGWASPYTGEAMSLREATVEQVASQGFMSHYATVNELEDIAETIAWPVVRRLYETAGVAIGPRTGRRGYGCEAMRRHQTQSVPADLAAEFTKVSFMRSLGAISEADFDDCVGSQTGFPPQQEGIAVYQDGVLRRSYSSGVAAGIGLIDGDYHFNLTADGTATFGDADYPGTLRLEIDLGADASEPIDRVSWPRGAFDLGLISPHDFTLRLDGAPAGNFDVTDGFVLITEASNDRIIGSVFVTEVIRFQAPLPVPQVFDPPLQFRILLDNTN